MQSYKKKGDNIHGRMFSNPSPYSPSHIKQPQFPIHLGKVKGVKGWNIHLHVYAPHIG